MLFIKERCPCPQLPHTGPNSFVAALLTARVRVVAALAPVKITLNLRAQTRFVKTLLVLKQSAAEHRFTGDLYAGRLN